MIQLPKGLKVVFFLPISTASQKWTLLKYLSLVGDSKRWSKFSGPSLSQQPCLPVLLRDPQVLHAPPDSRDMELAFRSTNTDDSGTP